MIKKNQVSGFENQLVQNLFGESNVTLKQNLTALKKKYGFSSYFYILEVCINSYIYKIHGTLLT